MSISYMRNIRGNSYGGSRHQMSFYEGHPFPLGVSDFGTNIRVLVWTPLFPF